MKKIFLLKISAPSFGEYFTNLAPLSRRNNPVFDTFSHLWCLRILILLHLNKLEVVTTKFGMTSALHCSQLQTKRIHFFLVWVKCDAIFPFLAMSVELPHLIESFIDVYNLRENETVAPVHITVNKFHIKEVP